MIVNKVWHKGVEKMFYVKQFNRCLYEQRDCLDKEPITDFDVKDLVFLQNTHVKFGSPSNSKEAFQSDVVESIHSIKRYEVIYNDGSFALWRTGELLYFPNIDTSFYVIKGNKYENPELLKFNL